MLRRRTLVVAAILSLMASAVGQEPSEAVAPAPRQDERALGLLRRTEKVPYHVLAAGLKDLSAKFVFEETGAPKPERKESRVTGNVLFLAPDRVRVDVAEGEESASAAKHELEKNWLGALSLTSPGGFDWSTELDVSAVTLVDEHTVEIVPPKEGAMVASLREQGWQRVAKIRLRFDERDRCVEQTIHGILLTEGLGAMTRQTALFQWKEVDGKSVAIGLETMVAQLHMVLAREVALVDGFVVPVGQATTLSLGDGPALRSIRLTLSDVVVNRGVDPRAFDGYVTYEDARKSPEPLAVGDVAPAFELDTPDGAKVRLADLRGKVVLLDFWATWCGPCRQAMPSIQALHGRFKDRPVAVLGVNCWQDRDPDGDPVAVMKEMKLSYPLLLQGDAVAKEYHVAAIPTFVLIGPDGRIALYERGVAKGSEETLSAKIEALLTDRAR